MYAHVLSWVHIAAWTGVCGGPGWTGVGSGWGDRGPGWAGGSAWAPDTPGLLWCGVCVP